MKNSNKPALILAYEYEGDFHPEDIISDLGEALANLEYGDVANGEFEIWEYPSGKIFKVEPDRRVESNLHWSSPAKDQWMPRLVQISKDVEKVAKAYERLSNPS